MADFPEQVYRPLREFFDQAAADWDERVTVDPDFLATVVDVACLRPGDTALDVGCGTGVLLPHLLSRVGDAGRVYALDISPLMLERARARCPQAVCLCAPAEAIPLPAGSCRAVVCYSAFPHFPDQARALAEMARVVATGGRVVIAHAESRQAINDMHRRLGGPVAHHLLPDEATMRRLVAQVGLRVMSFRDAAGYLLVAALLPHRKGR